jgi:hypothetical protein
MGIVIENKNQFLVSIVPNQYNSVTNCNHIIRTGMINNTWQFVCIILASSMLAMASGCCLEGGKYDANADPDICSCLICPRGYRCPDNMSVRFECEAGHYQPLSRQSACIICPKNTYCQGTKNHAFVPCHDALTSEAGSTLCSSCPSSHYQVNNPLSCVKKDVCTDTQYQDETTAGTPAGEPLEPEHSQSPIFSAPTVIYGATWVYSP